MYVSARKWLAEAPAATVARMARGRGLLVATCLAWLLVAAGARPAAAGVSRRSHRVASGESLWKIARANQCTVDDLRRANRIHGDSLHPGQRLRIPRCGARAEAKPGPARRARAAEPARRAERRPIARSAERDADDAMDADGMNPDADADVDAVARGAERAADRGTDRDTDDLTDMGVPEEEPIDPYAVGSATTPEAIDRAPAVAMIDRSAVDRMEDELDRARADEETEPVEPTEPATTEPVTRERGRGRGPSSTGERRTAVGIAVPLRGQSFGRPQNGYLVSGTHMPPNSAAYFLRRPERAWGARHAVDQVVGAIRAVRRQFPRVKPLAIGDFSARHGGTLSMHGSHQSGRDADIGFYFRRQPRGYPRGFAVATADNLDFPATWALISAFLRTAGKPGGVERIYMTYTTQALFYRLARKHGVPRARLDAWFQYPHGRRADHGFIRHWPGHTEHIHVRFRCAASDAECR